MAGSGRIPQADGVPNRDTLCVASTLEDEGRLVHDTRTDERWRAWCSKVAELGVRGPGRPVAPPRRVAVGSAPGPPATPVERTDVKTINGLQELVDAEGADLGASEWVEITQERIDQFADATGDHQWIHVDPDRARSGPFGTTIAHGFLTLSMLPAMMSSLYTVEGISMAINYGLDKVRFVAPVPVGSRVRAATTLVSVKELDGAAQATYETTIEIEGSDKPAAVVASIARYIA